MKRVVVLTAILVSLAAPAFAASDLSGWVNADNYFKVYLSTDDDTLGELIFSSPTADIPGWDHDVPPYDWADSHAISAVLTPHVTNYLHIVVGNAGASGGLLGDFTLSNSAYQFANGSSRLLTDTVNWKVYTDHFGGTLGALAVTETDGASWRRQAEIDDGAAWIWTGTGDGYDGSDQTNHVFRYFSTPITATPEPLGAGLFILGGGALAVLRRKHKV